MKHASGMRIDPGGCARYAIDIHGKAGVEWLERLPEIISGWAERWSLEILPPFEQLTFNYLTSAIRADGAPVVLKAGVPGPELWREMDALRRFGGDGVVCLLDADREWGVLLLERLLPGTPLTSVQNDEQVVLTVTEILRRIWKPLPGQHPFPTVAQWSGDLTKLHARFDGGYGPFPQPLVDRAEGLFQELLREETEVVLLHGDVHPQNILKSSRQPWLAIDPKGVAGSRFYDAADFLCSIPKIQNKLQRKTFLERRSCLLAETLGYDRQRILGWGVALSVLSGWWSFEDHGAGWEWAFSLAADLASLSR